MNDTGVIRDEAEIYAHICRVEVISAAEATILGDPARVLTGIYLSIYMSIYLSFCRVEVISAAEATILGDPARVLTDIYLTG